MNEKETADGQEKSGTAIMNRFREERSMLDPDRHAIMLTRALLHLLIYEAGHNINPQTQDLVCEIIKSSLSGLASANARLVEQMCDLVVLNPKPIQWPSQS